MGLPAERLYPTVHPDDEDAYAIWRDEIGVPEERIGKLADNWWGPVGNSGPNGPDSEIYFDLGEEHGDTGDGPGDGSRYLEVWNNVFMEFLQAPDGSRTKLARPCVDTGMGLERLTMVMQAARSVYDTDIYQAIIQRAANLAKVTYRVDDGVDRALRVIADHARGSTFLIADGVLPGNEGRAYVLRRLLRRAIRHGRKLGLERPFMAEMAGVVIDQFAADYPNLRERRGQIERVLTHEEETFGRTLRQGETRFLELVDGTAVTARLRADRRPDEAEDISEGAPAGVISGEEAFRLYDTYGFPIDLTIEMAHERGFTVDQVGFDAAMAAQRAASRGGAAFKDEARGRAELYVALGGRSTEFLGYDQTEAEATIVGIVGPAGALDEAEAGQPVEIILDRTPFYGESGGQIGDTGSIRTETGLIDVDDTVKPTPDLIVHRGTVAEGFVKTGEEAVGQDRRRSPPRDPPQPHRHPPAPPGAADRPRRGNAPGRIARRARPANPLPAGLLRKSLVMNWLHDRTDVRQRAMGSQSGQLKLRYSPEVLGGATLAAEGTAGTFEASTAPLGASEEIDVEVATLDTDFPVDLPIRLLKIDAEGFEHQVLRGGARLLERHCIDLVMLECVQEVYGAAWQEFLVEIKKLIEFGYEPYILDRLRKAQADQLQQDSLCQARPQRCLRFPIICAVHTIPELA